MSQEKQICTNCGTELLGDYCHNCGQKLVINKSFKYVIAQFLGALYYMDGKLFRSLKFFFFNPGKLSREFVVGRLVYYMSPISLFFVFNICYFLFNSATDFNLTLIDQIKLQPYSSWAEKLVNNHVEKVGTTIEAFTEIYEDESANLSKTLIIVNIPVLALFVWLLNWKNKYYFVDHFIYATYLMAFILFMFTFLFKLFYYFKYFLVSWFSLDVSMLNSFSSGFMALLYMVYVFISFGHTYESKWPRNLLASLVMFFGFVIMNFYYRFFLFLMTYWSVS